MPKIAVVVGSTREGSFNRALGRLAIRTGQQRTITVTPVTVPEYCKAAHGLADSAHAVGVPGVLLAASAGVGCADHPLVVQRVYFERLPWSERPKQRSSSRLCWQGTKPLGRRALCDPGASIAHKDTCLSLARSPVQLFVA